VAALFSSTKTTLDVKNYVRFSIGENANSFLLAVSFAVRGGAGRKPTNLFGFLLAFIVCPARI